ncbi:MAG: aspartate aminotransferase family protein [Methylophilaceae bacterium]
MSQHLMNTYGRLPVTFTKGQGVWLWDDQGEQYLDALSGIAVTGLGHSHPKFVQAINEQASTLMHVSNVYQIAEQERLADKLAELSGMDKVFFCNSGCEANEALIKLARLHAHNQEIADPEIIVMEQSFHGRTMATLSATGSRKVQAGFEPLVKGFVRVPFDDLDAVKQVAARKNNVVAILVEPVQGEGGIQIPVDMKAYLQGLREVCDENGWLLMLDEVQSGIGRTGTWFAFQHTGITPDAMALAKGLGSGLPIGACVAKGKAAEVFTPGKHGSTFGGNPFASAAGLATLEIIAEEKLRENAKEMGSYINQLLTEAFQGNAAVVNIRNAGLMVGVELDKPCAELVKLALANQLLINVTADNVIRLLPPLVINKQEAQELVTRLVPVVENFLKTA